MRMPKRNPNGEKYMEALATLEARITKLEARPLLSEGIVAKLALAPGDMLSLYTPRPLEDNVMRRLRDEISAHMGFEVPVVHTWGDHKIGIFQKQEL